MGKAKLAEKARVSNKLEFYGDYWHSLPKNKSRDKKRDRWLIEQGYTVVRILESNIKQDAVEAVTTALQLNN